MCSQLSESESESEMGAILDRMLLNAATTGDLDRVKTLSAGRIVGRFMETIEAAACLGHLDVVRFLCEEQAPEKTVGEHALMNAIINQHWVLAWYLMKLSRAQERGVFATLEYQCEWALRAAARFGQTELVKHLCALPAYNPAVLLNKEDSGKWESSDAALAASIRAIAHNALLDRYTIASTP